MYTHEIFNHFQKLNNNIAISEYLRVCKDSPQIKGVTYNVVEHKYEICFEDTKEKLFFLLYNG